MRTRLVNRWIVVALLGVLSLALSAVRFAQSSQTGHAWTTSNYSWVLEPFNSNDGFMNYDGDNPGYSTNVDWPIRFVWFNAGDLDTVKAHVDGCNAEPYYPQICIPPGSLGEKSLKFKENGTVDYDTDSGLKQMNHCELDPHIRVFGDPVWDSWYNANWGYYVVASVHLDKEFLWVPFDCPKEFWSRENDEEYFWNTRVIGLNSWYDPDWVIYTNTYYFANPETARWADYNHYVSSNGYASGVFVP